MFPSAIDACNGHTYVLSQISVIPHPRGLPTHSPDALHNALQSEFGGAKVSNFDLFAQAKRKSHWIVAYRTEKSATFWCGA